MLAIAVGQSTLLLDPPPSRASPLPQSTAFPLKVLGQIVGAELARDGGGSACIDAECAAVFASRLSSHRDCIQTVI
ncbi:Hypothetical protein; putative exported protein [Pseudomonas brassicacearum subsp. brassicacearum NFM421]|uniref:Uncharacterized protein n=1 Tax=Pseudomonas brassicacearum (strain NFM421) TaxID=994484 RepID=F2K7S7_PSEBN|nr:Hypothetical protein; putative exported protein [Pseudomonas brassicacearum subsp. brassicacearum NFM421]